MDLKSRMVYVKVCSGCSPKNSSRGMKLGTVLHFLVRD